MNDGSKAGSARFGLERDVGRITPEYWTEKVEAYNIAIEALRAHEPGSDCDLKLAARLRERLAEKLDREIQRWCDANPKPNAN